MNGQSERNFGQLGQVGKIGENAACEYLKRNGYEIIGRNFRSGRNEIDIICTHENHVVFIEVKTRTAVNKGNGRFGSPASAVTYDKKKRIISAARDWLRQNRTGLYPRIDVIEVYLEKGTDRYRIIKINHFRNAVTA